jgi:hypothetical protein
MKSNTRNDIKEIIKEMMIIITIILYVDKSFGTLDVKTSVNVKKFVSSKK